MNGLERQMTMLLRTMKDEFDLTGVKGEFEAEGARLEELMRLKEISSAAGVSLTVKIGGCEAITDMRLARSLGADELVAPMIESPFAIKKYLNAAALVYPEKELGDVRLLINVETIDGVRNFENMCRMKEIEKLSGLDIGRVDMAASMGLLPEGCNSHKVFESCLAVCERWKSLFPEKSCTLGGLLNRQTILFLERMPKKLSIGCESKKSFSGQV